MLEQLQTEYSELAVELQQLRMNLINTLEGLENEQEMQISKCGRLSVNTSRYKRNY